MKKFVYDTINVRETRLEKEYECPNGDKSYNLMSALDIAGEQGWELVGEIESKIILKKEVG